MQQLEYYPIEALHWAGMGDKNLYMLQDILAQFPEYIHAKNVKNDNLLHIAVRTGGTEIAKYLINHTEVDIHAKTDEGNVLLTAIKYNESEIAKFLIEKGIDINSTDDQNKNAIFYAAKYGNDKIVELLLKHNVNINHLDNMKRNALFIFMEHYNAHKNYWCFELIQSNMNHQILMQKDVLDLNIFEYMDSLIKEAVEQDNLFRAKALEDNFSSLKNLLKYHE